MKNIIMKLLTLILIIILITAYSSSYTSLNIDNLAFVVALGIDKSDSKNLKITFEFINVSSSDGGVNDDSKIIIDTVESSSLTNAVNIMNSYLGKKLDMSHCKIIVFSEEIATDGITDEIYSLMNDVQIRPSANIIVSKCNASYYIESSKPSLENLVTKYYDIFPNSSKYTGYICNATIGDFFEGLLCDTCEPYAILGGVQSSNSSNSNSNSNSDSSTTQNSSNNDSNIKAGETSIQGARTAQNMGMAVFKNGKLAGELNAIQTTCFLAINKSVQSFLISIPNPQEENSNLDIYIITTQNTNINVSIVNGAPYIKLNFKFSGKIYSMNRNEKYLDSSVLNLISDASNKYLETQMKNYLYLTSTQFRSDINGFGKYIQKDFKTNSDFDSYNWLENYKNATFDVKVDTIINSGFMINQT